MLKSSPYAPGAKEVGTARCAVRNDHSGSERRSAASYRRIDKFFVSFVCFVFNFTGLS